jgi:hypothetical protein
VRLRLLFQFQQQFEGGFSGGRDHDTPRLS